MTATALTPLAGHLSEASIPAALALLLLAAACAPSGQTGYGAADRAAMDALHAAGLRTAVSADGQRVTATGEPGVPFRRVVYDR